MIVSVENPNYLQRCSYTYLLNRRCPREIVFGAHKQFNFGGRGERIYLREDRKELVNGKCVVWAVRAIYL